MFNLSGTNLNTPCDLRAEIYRDTLLNVHRVFNHSIPAPHGYPAAPNDARVNTALSRRKLLEALAKILDEYVMVGVAADMQRWRFIAYDGAVVPAAPAAPPNVDFLKSNNTRGPNPSPANNYDVAQAYQDYFQRYILPNQVTQDTNTTTGIEAFYRRRPMIRHAVTTCARNFCENVCIACNHIIQDWDTIGTIFFPGNPPTNLTKITSTGSDFHKGGKQVLILTFQLQNGELRKLVYKPSDVEMDYRLVGNTENIRNNDGTYHLGDRQSLTELINSFFPPNDQFNLPTYRILPRNPGSGLNPDAQGILPIQDSYGYIEFLTHSPKKDRNTGDPMGWHSGQRSDWVAENMADVRKFYRQWGRILAMATIFSLSDMHKQNIIVHNLQPHLIDLEISFTGPMSRIQETMAIGTIFGLELGRVNRRHRANDKTANLVVNDVGKDNEAPPEASANRLWLSQGGGTPVRPVPNLYFTSLYEGFWETMKVLRDHSVTFNAWLNAAQQAIARFTPYSTGEFNNRVRRLYSPTHCSSPVPNHLNLADFNRQPFIDWQTRAVGAYNNPNTPPEGEAKGWPSPRPNFAIQTPAHNFADYLNCDVPAYYHRLNTDNLLDARGATVNVQAANPIPGPVVDFPSPSRNTYFAENTYNIVCSQLDALGQGTFKERMTPWTNELRQVFGVKVGRIGALANWLRGRP